MEIYFNYNRKYHLICIILGIILGLTLGIFSMKQFNYDINEIKQKYEDINVQINDESIIENMEFQKSLFPCLSVLLIGGIFNGMYLFISYIKSKLIVYKILSVAMFPFVFMICSFIGILLLIPLFIYDIYCIIKNNIVPAT